MRQRHLYLIAAATALSVSVLGGCVRQEKYDNLLTDNRTLNDRVNESENERDAARGEIDELKAQLRLTQQRLDDILARNTSLSGELGQIGADLQAIAEKLQAAGGS